MKTRLLLLLLALLGGHSVRAATYYLAATGDDARTAAQAQNPATPWQSLAKLNASMGSLQPGDQVLFRRGDVFRGQLLITRSGSAGQPLTFGAYGGAATDPAPVLNASAPLSGWVNMGPNVWEAPCPSCGPTVTGVYAVGGRALPLGRYPNLSAPNRGYLPMSSHQDKIQLASSGLVGSWVGGEAVVRAERWILERALITAQGGTTLTIDNAASRYELRNGWGFFIQNHPATLDQPDEWYFDAAARKIRLYAAAAPADGAIEATTAAPAGVRIDRQQYVVLENLTLTRSYQLGLDAQDASHCVVRGVQVLDAGQDGVRINGTGTDVLLENNLVQNVNNNGVQMSGYEGFTFRNNVLRNIGLVPGRGLGGDGQYYATGFSSANRVLVQDNTLDSLGYVGLVYSAAGNVTIERNVVSNFCLTKDDGGGIYTYNGGVYSESPNARILHNIVMNATGAPDGAEPGRAPAHGIYLDDCSLNVEVRGNTVAHCASGGIYLHGVHDVVVRDNTCFDNGVQLTTSPSISCDNYRLTIENNVLVSADPAKSVADYNVPPAALAQLGTIGSNVYARPFDDVLKVRAGYRNYQLSDWQAASGYDAGSRDSPVRFRPYRVDARPGSSLVRNGAFTANTTDWYDYASAGNGRLTWDNTNRLGSGGSLRLGFEGSSGRADQFLHTATFVGAVRAGQRFAVRFRAACATGTKLVGVYLKRTNGYNVAPLVRVLLTPTATDYEIALLADIDYPNTTLVFNVDEDANQVWLDNVDLYEATLTAASVADSIRFEYNATAAPRTVALPAGARFVDARNAPYGGSLTLAPFASVVLLRVNAATAIAAAVAPLSVELSEFTAVPGVRLWPNPTAGPTTLDLRGLPAGRYQLTLLDATGRVLRQLTRAAGQTYPLELGGLPRGVYLLRGQGPGGAFGRRVVRE